jgi:Flp pilus assembly protein TadB
MKKTIGMVLLVAGLAGIGLGFAYTASSDAQQECERMRSEAVTLLEQATQAGEGTEESQALVAQAQEKSDWADGDCARADSMRQQGLMISGAGLLVLVIGLVLFLKAKKAPSA